MGHGERKLQNTLHHKGGCRTWDMKLRFHYAAEDIVNADSKIIVAKDTHVEKAVTGTDGKCVFVSDLPLGQYYVKEIEEMKG